MRFHNRILIIVSARERLIVEHGVLTKYSSTATILAPKSFDQAAFRYDGTSTSRYLPSLAESDTMYARGAYSLEEVLLDGWTLRSDDG